uniref:PLP-dependent aminotransferase family protein n=1 Tax=Coralloluteibacterium stylophorae TaxID=1776034 RepID=A0A8J8AWM2_9GAMM
MKRYELLADDIARSIAQGVLRPGERLPSVRQTSQRRSVSPSTVFQAYYLLEARGLVRPRDRSGYYVANEVAALLPELDTASRPTGDVGDLDVSARVFEILESTRQREVVPLGSAFPSPLLFPLDALARAQATATRTLDPWASVDDLTPGNAELRRLIARRYLADGIELDVAEIVITNGALEALNLCLAAVTRPGDTVLVESPTFYAALQALERNGLRAVQVPTHPRDGIDPVALVAAVERHRPRACWIMSCFQYPLGSLMPEASRRALAALLARHGIPLIEDDVYGELYFDERRPLPAKAFDADGGVLHCGSFSKSLAPGYRIGWVAAGRHARSVARLKLSTSLATSAPGQAALAHYLQQPGYDRHLRRLRHTLALQQTAFAQAIARHFPPGTRATRPRGGYFMWLELDPRVDALRLHRQALDAGISIAPGPIFSARQEFRNCVRLNYGHIWDARTEAALRTLGELVRAQAG